MAWEGSGGVGDIFRYHADTHGDIIALETPAVSISYREVYSRATALARGLSPRIVAGDRPVALHLPRGPDWLCCTVAAALLGIPFLWLSADGHDPEAEAAFNLEALKVHTPQLIIAPSDVATLSESAMDIDDHADPPPSVEKESPATEPLMNGVSSENHAEANGHPLPLVDFFEASVSTDEEPPAKRPKREPTVVKETDLLCWFATGGSLKRKWVAITHQMVLHELEHYPSLATLGPTDKVLQNSGVMWGAAALGQLDIALAFGCTAVVVDVSLPPAVAHAVKKHSITCFGGVPSVLAALRPEDLCPPARVLFTWGEAISEEVAARWAAADVTLLDLLISTEYWLCLYAKRTQSGPSVFQPLPGILHRVLQSNGKPCALGAIGELYLAGPNVCRGYSDPMLTARSFLGLNRPGCTQWFRTRDLVRVAEDGLQYCGRADATVKLGGVWVDLTELEERLSDELIGRAAIQRIKRDGARSIRLYEREQEIKKLQDELRECSRRAGLERFSECRSLVQELIKIFEEPWYGAFSKND